jgi:hypothetical protein
LENNQFEFNMREFFNKTADNFNQSVIELPFMLSISYQREKTHTILGTQGGVCCAFVYVDCVAN